MAPPLNASLRVQVVPVQDHPVPDVDTSVRPVGRVWVNVTVPAVGPAVAPLLTITVHAARACPCVKLPVWLSETLRSGVAATTVLSEAVAVADPPPDTLTCVVSGLPALDATFTVTVRGG